MTDSAANHCKMPRNLPLRETFSCDEDTQSKMVVIVFFVLKPKRVALKLYNNIT
jgi:hypothetical protein